MSLSSLPYMGTLRYRFHQENSRCTRKRTMVAMHKELGRQALERPILSIKTNTVGESYGSDIVLCGSNIEN